MFKPNETRSIKDQISPPLYDKLIANKEAPVFNDFADVFSSEEISQDQDLIKDWIASRGPEASQYQKSQKQWADAFEVLVSLQIELGDWLGSDVMTAFTSEYDDLVHAVDGVIEIRGEEGESSKNVRLGFDCTFSEQELEKKITRMWDRLNTARLYNVKYFISPHSEEKLSLRDIPLVTIFTNKQMVQELAEQWSANKRRLNDHPFKFLVLEQILFQLLAMRAYLKAPHCSARGAKRYRIQDRIDEVVEAVSANVQKALVTSVDENVLRYVSNHPHIQEVQTKVERVFNLRFTDPVLPRGYTTALQWALDRDASSIVRDVPIPEVASSPVPKQEARKDIRSLSEPKPWEMTNQAAAQYLTSLLKKEFSGQPITIAPIADATLQKALLRIVPSEKERGKLIHDRRTADGNYYPHLSPELIERLRQEFISIYKTPVPSPGEVTRVEMVRRIQERFDIGKNAANDLINKFVAGKTECVIQRRRPEDTDLIKCYRVDEIFRVLEAVSGGGS